MGVTQKSILSHSRYIFYEYILSNTFFLNFLVAKTNSIINIREYSIPNICADDGNIAIKKNVKTLSSTNNKIAPKAKIVNRT